MLNKAGTQTIETHRLILRPFRADDAQDMFDNWASDPEVTRYLTWPTHSSVAVTRQVLDEWIPRYADGGFFNWAIVLREEGRAVGNIAVVQFSEETESAVVGYCLGRAYWGRGIMPEALRAVMDYLFDTVGVNRVASYHDTNNPKSGRVMAKAGMKREGTLRSSDRNNQGICDAVWYALVRTDREAPRHREKAEVTVRFARDDELDSVNVLRRQVNELHVKGKPEVFKPGFTDELRDYIHVIRNDPKQEIVVAELNGKICGFAILNHIVRPENPFMYVRDYLDVDEFGVDGECRRQGVASAMIGFIHAYAKEKGYSRLELNMWEFNRGALAFYESAGFRTFRRYLEIML